MAERFTLYPVFQKISKWGGVSIFAANNAVKFKKNISLLVLTVLVGLYPILIGQNLKISDLVLSLYVLCFVVLATSSVFCNIYINFSQTENVRKLFKCFAVLDFYLKKHGSGNILKEDVRFYIFWIVSHFTLLASLSVDITHRILTHKLIILLKLLILNLTGHYLTYLLTLTVLQFTCIVYTIQTVLKLLNGQIHEVFSKTEVLCIRRRERLKCLMKCYDKVFEITALCNKIFGVLILVVYPYLLVYFVRIVTFFIKFTILGELASESLNKLLFFSDFLGCLLCVVSRKINTRKHIYTVCTRDLTIPITFFIPQTIVFQKKNIHLKKICLP